MVKSIKKLPFVYRILFFSILVFGASCNPNDLDFNDVQLPNYTGEVALPIGETSYTMQELIEELQDSTLTIDIANNNFITVIYTDSSEFNDPSDFITFGAIENTADLNPNITAPPSPRDSLIVFTEAFEFEFQPSEGEQIDSLTYSIGDATLRVTSSFNSDLNYTLKIIDFQHTETGDTLTFDGVNSTLTTKDLADYKTVFIRVNEVNQFSLLFEGTLDVKAGETVTPAEFLTFTLTIDNTEFKSVFGFFGSNETSIQDQSITLDFFDDINPGGFEFNSPEIKINMKNSFGVPVGIAFSGVSASNSSGDMINLSGPITETLQTVRAPSINNVGDSISSEISIDSKNSNLRDLLNIAPNLFTLAITGTSNFGNESGAESNFLTDSSYLKTKIEVHMPLDIRLNNFTREFNFDVDNSTLDEKVDSLKLRIQTFNELPISGSIVINFLDETDQIIHQIPQTVILDSPEVNNIDKTVEAFHNTAIITLDPTGITAFSMASKINMTLYANTYQSEDGTFVKIYSDYQLTIKLSAIANLNAEIKF